MRHLHRATLGDRVSWWWRSESWFVKLLALLVLREVIIAGIAVGLAWGLLKVVSCF